VDFAEIHPAMCPAQQRPDEAAWLAALVESSEDAIISIDLNGILTSWNPAAERLYGYLASEIIGQTNYLIIPDDRRVEEESVRQRILAGQPVEHYESVRVRKDGTRVDVAMTVSPLRARDGAIVGISKISRDLRQRERAVLEKSRVEQQLRQVVDAMTDAFAAVDCDGRFTYVNDRYVQMARTAREDLIGRVVWDVFPEAAKLRMYDEARRALAENRSASFEEHYPPYDLWYHTRIYPTGDGLAMFTTDITDRKRIERVTEESLAAVRRLAAIVESSEDGIIGMTLDGIITAWNQGAERMYGYTAAEAVGQSIRLIVPDGRRDEETVVLGRIRRGERVDHFETVRCRKDGTCFPVSLVVSPIRDEAGAVVGASKNARDISELKRGSQRAAFLAEVGTVLAGSLEYLTTLKTVANLAVPSIADWCAVDIMTEERKLERLAVAHVDPAKLELARTIRSRYEDTSSPYSATSVVRTGTPAMLKEVTDDMIVASARGDQERIAVLRSLGLRSYMIVPLTARGRTLGTLTFATAESGRLYNEDDFRFVQDVAYRAALAVDNARAYDDAQAANRLKDEFLATLSHELRTPLNAILGYSRMLQSGMLTEDKHAHALQTVERNATSLTQIVEDILDVSRIISGKIRLNIQPVDLPAVVGNAVETVMPAAVAKEIRVQSILDPRAAPVSGDPDRMQQIVWNLVSNAVKFTPKHGVVQVRLERVNSHVEIVVSDTGIGIAPDFLPHIFERFRQADSGTTREHGGIGLGLAIVRHLVELHGGTIHAASGGIGSGSTFRVRFPVMIIHHEEPMERRIHPTTNVGRIETPLPDLGGLSVLAVDDDADARALVSETLESRGALVVSVDSVEEAFDTLSRKRPDVLLADIGMAHSDGFELIKRIRQSSDPAVREVPAAALTAYARAEDRMKVLQSGFQMHLAKPVDPAELIVAVASLAKRTTPKERR
jgi:PAS domain S-box-containing protein